MNTVVPFDKIVIDEVLAHQQVEPGKASIREMHMAVSEIERRLSTRFLRMEFGIPGLEPNPIGPEGEIAALRNKGVASSYAPLTGIPQVKQEGSLFLKKFLNVDISPHYVIPTVGSMQGSFLAQAVIGRSNPQKNVILFVDPSFSVHRVQTKFLGLEAASVDLFERESWLTRLEDRCKKGDVAAIVYSSPNNPTWVILTEDETQKLGEIASLYDAVVIEDSAYFGMDFRQDYSVPGEPPYPTTVARYTDNYVILFSASKIFSFAGERAALAFLSPKLSEREFPALETYFGCSSFYDAFVMSGIYCTTSSVPQGGQYALTAFLSKANRGEFNFLSYVKVYADRAQELRKIFEKNGFSLVYSKDVDQPLSDGFFFTFSYPGFDGGSLVRELLYYGISAIALSITGSHRSEAVRACVSLIGKEDFKLFESRIKAFRKDHPAVARASGATSETRNVEKVNAP